MYPILLEFGPITLFSLWFLVALGFGVSSWIFVRLAKRYRVKLTILTQHSLTLFLGTLSFSRFFFILTHPTLFFSHFNTKTFFSLFAIWDKGLSFWGAVAGWFLGIWYVAKKQKESPLKLFDLFVPSLLVGMFFGNLGTFFDGINYGTPTNLPWGITFRSANVKFISPIHPTQLYMAMSALLVTIILLILLKKIRGRLPGFVTEVGLFLLSLSFFFEEFVRGDETIKLFSIRLPQLIAAAFTVLSSYLLYQRYTNRTGGDPDQLLKISLHRLLHRKKERPPLLSHP